VSFYRPNLLRPRDLNVHKKQDNTNLKVGAVIKHKTSSEDEKDGPTRPKRIALGEITEVFVIV
jgi:hypothetical protein